jgi:hypothetical protein
MMIGSRMTEMENDTDEEAMVKLKDLTEDIDLELHPCKNNTANAFEMSG